MIYKPNIRDLFHYIAYHKEFTRMFIIAIWEKGNGNSKLKHWKDWKQKIMEVVEVGSTSNEQ